MTLFYILMGLGVPVGVIIGIFVVLQYPKAIGQFLRLFGYAGQWIRRKSLTTELEGTVNSFANSFNSDFESPILPECKVEWVNDKNIEQLLKSGKAIVKLSFSKNDHDLNFYNAAQAFIQTGFLNQTKPFLHKPTSTAIDLLMTKILLVNHRRSTLRIFNSRFSEQTDASKELFSKLEETEARGLFRQMFVQELHYFGENLGLKSPQTKYGDEADLFLAWFYELATREEKEFTRLTFFSEHLKVGVILVADIETYQKRGLRPYLRRAQQYATAGCHTVYVLSRGSFHADIADSLIERLIYGGCFKKLTKKTRVIKPDHRGSITASCVSLRPNVSQIETNAWNYIEQDLKNEGYVPAVVENVECTSVRVDVYGIKVDLTLANLSVIRLLDARRFFFVDQTLQLKALQIERAISVLVLSNVETDTDPKHIIDEIGELGTVERTGVVTNILHKNGFEYALIVQFDHNGNQIACYVPRQNATYSRYVALSDKFRLDSSVRFIVERFDAEKGNYIGKICSIIDPWDEIARYYIGQRVCCVIRQITERHVTCEVIEGLEGSIFIGELSWDGLQENMRLIQSYKVGDNVTAVIIDIPSGRKQISLSLKRVNESDAERFFNSNKNALVDVIVERLSYYRADVSFDDGRLHGVLFLSETFWCKGLDKELLVGQQINLKVLNYDFRTNCIQFSLKQIQCVGFESLLALLRVGEEAVCEVLFCDDDRITVLVLFEAYRAHGYIHISEISNLIYFDFALMRSVFTEGSCWACSVKRYDLTNQIIELSRKTFLRKMVPQFKSSDMCQVQVYRGRQFGCGQKTQLFGYADQIEGVFINTRKADNSAPSEVLIASVRGYIELSFLS